MFEDKRFDVPIFFTISSAIVLLLFVVNQVSENVSPSVLNPPGSGTEPLGAPQDWKDYSVPTLGLSLKYPASMTYKEWKPSADILHSVSFYVNEDVAKPLYKVPEITVSVFSNPKKQAPREWAMARSDRTTRSPLRDSAAFFQGQTEPGNIIVSGADGVTFGEAFDSVRAQRALVGRNNFLYSVTWTNFGDDKLAAIYKDVLSSIRWSAPRGVIQQSSASSGSLQIDETNGNSGPVLHDVPITSGFRLPWTAGTSLRVIQGWGGSSSHTCPGQMCNAYDFDSGSGSFEGTAIRASAGGQVVHVKGDSSPDTCGGYDYRNLANHVTVNHPDGTATLYLHLKEVSVSLGALANGQGTIVGLGGKTGWTGCYAHLHFQRQAQGIWITNSTPVYFDEYPNAQLKELNNYVSQNGAPASSCNNPSPSADQIGLYTEPNYCGSYKILGLGQYPTQDTMGIPNDTASSIKVGGNVRANLCKDINFSGACFVATADDPDLSDTVVGNKQLSSLQVIARSSPNAWHAQYYGNMSLSGSPVVERDDADVNFDWGLGSPDPRLPADRFSARWTRTMNLTAGTYRFTTTTDDGVRLWVDNVLVIDQWRDQSSTSYNADVTLGAGNHTVKMEYYENGVTAVAKLSYGINTAPPQPPNPNAWRGQYYSNMSLSGSPAVERDDTDVNFDWGGGSPDPRLPADRFSARWTRTMNLPAGTYRFTTTTDDGVRLWVDNALVIDQWRDQSSTSYNADVTLGAGNHTVRMEYYENGGTSVAKLSYSINTAPPQPPNPNAWRGQYYSNMSLSGSPVVERDDADVNFDWGTGSPDPRLPADRFSARWTRTLSLAAGTYHFTTTTDDGVRLWVDNVLVIDQWRDQSSTSYNADVTLGAGNHTVRMEYYENGGAAVAKLSYSTNTAPSPLNAWHAQYYSNMSLSGSPVFERDDAYMNFDWGVSGADPRLPPERFSVRWTRTMNLPAGTYRFTTTTDDGVRLWVDNALVIDQWRDQSSTSYNADVILGAGNHTVRMEYYQNRVAAVAKLSYVLLR